MTYVRCLCDSHGRAACPACSMAGPNCSHAHTQPYRMHPFERRCLLCRELLTRGELDGCAHADTVPTDVGRQCIRCGTTTRQEANR